MIDPQIPPDTALHDLYGAKGLLEVGGDCLDTAAAVETLGQLFGDRLSLAHTEVSQGRVMPATNEPPDVVGGPQMCDDVNVPYDWTRPQNDR